MTAYRPVPAPRHDLSAEQALEASRLFRATMATRRSIRDFSEEPFDLELIRNALVVANSAPSGANVQPWHFVVVTDREVKRGIREAAEREEKEFYASKASMAWLAALEPLGTDYRKPHLEKAPVGITAGFLLTALHHSGLETLTNTPSPMRFLNKILDRPSYERPYVVIPVGRAAPHAVVPDITKKEASEVTTWIPNSTTSHDVSD